MIDYRKEAIEANDELVGALDASLGYLQMFREIVPRRVRELVEKDLEAHTAKMEERKNRAQARQQALLKEDK
jgi:hypothetical protein